MDKEPTSYWSDYRSGTVVIPFDRLGALKPGDLLSDPAGETVYLPAAEELHGLFPPRAGETLDDGFWPNLIS